MKKLAGLLAILIFLISIPVFASQPILPNYHRGFSKKSAELNQVLPWASEQRFGKVTAYSTVGLIPQQKLERADKARDIWTHIFVVIKNWWWIEQIPKSFKLVVVSEAEFENLWPRQPGAVGLFVYPDEVWVKGMRYLRDFAVMHELLHKILSWIYLPNFDTFRNSRFPGYNQFIINGAEYAVNKLAAEMGSNGQNPAINPTRFERLWQIAKDIMREQGFVGVERTPAPVVVNQQQESGVSRAEYHEVLKWLYENWQAYNGSGETYVAIIMFSAILDWYNSHDDRTGIFDVAVCNAKKILDQQMGRLTNENPLVFYENRLISC